MSVDPASQDPELLRRLLRAKDRMDAASHEDWPVQRLARVSRVSEAHLLTPSSRRCWRRFRRSGPPTAATEGHARLMRNALPRKAASAKPLQSSKPTTSTLRCARATTALAGAQRSSSSERRQDRGTSMGRQGARSQPQL